MHDCTGAHILSGAVIETRSLTELLPAWKELGVCGHSGEIPFSQPVVHGPSLALSRSLVLGPFLALGPPSPLAPDTTLAGCGVRARVLFCRRRSARR